MSRRGLSLALLTAGLAFASLFVGRFEIEPSLVLRIIAHPGTKVGPWTYSQWSVVWLIRVPRTIMVVLAGMALATAGASFQAVFRNPLVAPSLLGVTQGAALGASVAILFASPSGSVVQLFAFSFGLLAVAISYFISRVRGTPGTLTLVLAGVAVSMFMSSMVGVMKFLAASGSEERISSLVFWLMGGFYRVYWGSLRLPAPIIIVSVTAIMLLRWRLNVLSMGKEEAESLGVDYGRSIGLVVVLATLMTAATVSVAGIISWIGLVIPHIARMLVGTDNRLVLPYSLAIGSSIMLVSDMIARVATTAEIPVGIITSFIGFPFFAHLLRRRRLGWA
ncbi:MAG: iron ABC transporter permease [Thermoplasmata archaeon]|nr:iron ABC transporter permease [Thermoplasmata archaeon]